MQHSGNNKAVFLDRDGTINEEVGYLSRLEDLHVFPTVPESVRIIKEMGFLAVLVTNQSGVARGFFPEDFVRTVFDKINEYLNDYGTGLDALYFCPHHPVYGIGPYKKSMLVSET